MKRVQALLLALTLIFTLAACGQTTEENQNTAPTDVSAAGSAGETATAPVAESATVPAAEPVELMVFAAASMTETLTQIAELYKRTAPHVTLTFTFDSSGTLLTQIKEGAYCDVFISAAQKQMNELDIESDKNSDGTDLVVSGSRFDLVENRVALAVPAGNPANLQSFEDVPNVNMIALGNSDVPVGQYSEEIFTNMGIWDALQDKITFGSNVKEVTSWVNEGAVDCGVVYSTDAYSAGLEVVAYAPDGTLKTPVLYPAAALKNSDNQDEAGRFLAFLQTPEASGVFEAVGFGIPEYSR